MHGKKKRLAFSRRRISMCAGMKVCLKLALMLRLVKGDLVSVSYDWMWWEKNEEWCPWCYSSYQFVIVKTVWKYIFYILTCVILNIFLCMSGELPMKYETLIHHRVEGKASSRPLASEYRGVWMTLPLIMLIILSDIFLQQHLNEWWQIKY